MERCWESVAVGEGLNASVQGVVDGGDEVLDGEGGRVASRVEWGVAVG